MKFVTEQYKHPMSANPMGSQRDLYRPYHRNTEVFGENNSMNASDKGRIKGISVGRLHCMNIEVEGVSSNIVSSPKVEEITPTSSSQ